MKRLRIFLATIVLFFVPLLAHASIVINEFLYDASGTDTDQEYVELLNTGESPVDLTKYKFNDGSNHALNAPPKNGGTGSLVIPAGGYVLLVNNAANFIAAHGGVSGTIIDTVLSLPNAGGTIALLDDKNVAVDTVTYAKAQRGNGDGNSLQRSGSSWIPAIPTPLTANATQAAAPKPPPQPKTSTKTAAKTTKTSTTRTHAAVVQETSESEPEVSDMSGDVVVAEPTAEISGASEVAAAGSVESGSYIWWLSALGLAALACGAAFWVKRMQKTEWTILDGE